MTTYTRIRIRIARLIHPSFRLVPGSVSEIGTKMSRPPIHQTPERATSMCTQ